MLRFRWETEFKDAEFEKIPKEWGLGRVRDVAKINELSIKEDFQHDRIEYIDITSVNNGELLGVQDLSLSEAPSRAKRIVRNNDILISTVRPNLKHFVFVKNAKSNTIASTGFAVVSSYKINPRYLYYFLTSEPFTIYLTQIAETQTSAYPAFTPDVIENAELPLPVNYGKPLGEDLRIGNILSWFDELIENKKRQNEVLEKAAMAVFKSWFVDFEPFKDGEFVPSELGEIPKQWCVKPLEEVATLFKGVSYSSSEISSEPQGSLFITLNNFLREGGFKLEYDYYIGSKARDEQKVKEGDLIIALTDMTPLAKVVGSPAIVSLPYGYDFGVISLDCGKLEFRKEFLRFYLYLYLKYTQEENSTFANGVNVLHLNTNLFMRNKLILMPPEPILEKFHALVEPLFQKIALNQKQILVLRKVKDTLLPLLVFGKLRVEEI
ncbi:MAG: restriction endonuclease subunit S [Nitrososphaeria archaeon]